MSINTYTNVAQKVSSIRNNNQPDKYRAVIKNISATGTSSLAKISRTILNTYTKKNNLQQTLILLPPKNICRKPQISNLNKYHKRITKISDPLTNPQNR